MEARPYTLVYDGDCGFCRRSVDLLASWDRRGAVEIVPFQATGVAERFPQIPPAAYREAMQLVATDGRTWSGAAAAEELTKVLPFGSPLGCLFAIPYARPIADGVYRFVARNRTRFGCSTHCPRG